MLDRRSRRGVNVEIERGNGSLLGNTGDSPSGHTTDRTAYCRRSPVLAPRRPVRGYHLSSIIRVLYYTGAEVFFGANT